MVTRKKVLKKTMKRGKAQRVKSSSAAAKSKKLASAKKRVAAKKRSAPVRKLTQQGTRRALCVGINLYPFGTENNLKGCVNDAHSWGNLLTTNFGFPAADVKLLLDSEATKKNVLAELKALVAGSKPGDLIVFQNSSHGSYVADTDGDEEVYDEILCPHDAKDNQIRDDELREIIAGLPKGARMTIILDNCFSGTGTRFLPLPTPDDRRVRFLNPALRGLPVLQDFASARPRSAGQRSMAKMREVLLTGCSDKEFSYDANINGTYQGAMTYSALSAIREAKGNLTYEELHRKIVERIQYPQHPQLEGNTANLKSKIFR